MFRGHPPAVALRRLPRLVFGLALMGTGITAMVVAGLGLGPWDVFHQGVATRTGLPIGTVVILTGLVVMVAWIPLRERIGIGTVANAVLIGTVVNLELPHFSTPASDAVRWALMLSGPLWFAVGSGFYIGTDLGPGPRDGIMTGLVRRGLPTWAVRAGIELTALLVGWRLGGTVGVGTVWFAVSIGPLVHFFLPRLAMETIDPLDVSAVEATGGE